VIGCQEFLIAAQNKLPEDLEAMNTLRNALIAAALFTIVLPAAYAAGTLTPPQPPDTSNVGHYIPGHYIPGHTVQARHVKGHMKKDGTYVPAHDTAGGFKPGHFVEGHFTHPRHKRL